MVRRLSILSQGHNKSMIEHYREWYEHEKDCNTKMLKMIASVPESHRSDPRFERAVQLAHHLAVCRENWLDRMTNESRDQKDWWPEGETHATLVERFQALEEKWTTYLRALTDEGLLEDFEFPSTDRTSRYRWSIEGQIVQLVGHAFYHRGQIAQIVLELGGESVDTDYLYWAYRRNPKYGEISE